MATPCGRCSPPSGSATDKPDTSRERRGPAPGREWIAHRVQRELGEPTWFMRLHRRLGLMMRRPPVVGRLFDYRYERLYRRLLTQRSSYMDVRGLVTRGAVSLQLIRIPLTARLAPSGGWSKLSDALPAIQDNLEFVDISTSTFSYLLGRKRDPLRLVVIGSPGSGKTTLLAGTVLEFCTKRLRNGPLGLQRGRVPFMLYLRQIASTICSDPMVPLSAVIRASLSSLVRQAEPSDWVERQLAAVRGVILLDGLDEVVDPSRRTTVTGWLDRQFNLFPSNSYMVTSRPAGYVNNVLTGATIVTLQPLDASQIDAFIRHWYVQAHATSLGRGDASSRIEAETAAEELITILRRNTDIAGLATNPLMLTAIINVHYYRAAVPGSRYDLISEICDIFLGRQQEAKGLREDLSRNQKAEVLGWLALAMMLRGIYSIGVKDATVIIEKAFSDIRVEITPETFLRSTESSSGLIMEYEAGFYRFAHLILQEFLAAVHIRDHAKVDILIQNVGDPRWIEVTALYCAQSDATPIIDAYLLAAEKEPALLDLATRLAREARHVSLPTKHRLQEALESRGEDGISGG
jgi:predicted NACHT family NTPase